MFFSHRVAKYW